MSFSFQHDYSAEYGRFRRRLSDPVLLTDFVGGFTAVLHGQCGVARGTSQAIGRSLFWRMSDPQIRYHTPLHVLSIFSWARRAGVTLSPWQELTLWFHDGVYQPRSVPGDNEALSALLARAMLSGFVSHRDLLRVERGVRATGLHLARRVPREMQVVLDLDICSFAWDRRNFLASSRALADELTPIVGVRKYRTGRRAFLVALLKKGFIYRSAAIRDRFESAARANIGHLLEHEPDLSGA